MASFSVEVIVKVVRTSGEHLDVQVQRSWSSPVLEDRGQALTMVERVGEQLTASARDKWIPW